MSTVFPDPGEHIPYTALMPDQQHALHAWLRQHQIDPGRVPLYARFDHDPATDEWRIPVYWHSADGRMRLNPDGETVRKHVVRRRQLSPLPWPTWGRPKVTWNGVDISDCVAGIEFGDDRQAACPDCGLPSWDADDLEPGDFVCTCMDGVWCAGKCGDPACGNPDRPIETIDTRGLL